MTDNDIPLKHADAVEALEGLLWAVHDGANLTIDGHRYLPDRAIRELRYRLKQAHKSIGKQGETIHLLRAELAEVRSLNSRIDRGDLRSLDRGIAKANAIILEAEARIAVLEEKLAEHDDE
jgi:hypothetical protein